MDHTIDIVFDFDESTVVGHIADLTDDVLAGGIFFSEDFPGVAFFLTETEGDLAAVAVDIEDDGFDIIADVENFAGLVDALGPGHFRNVDKTFDTGFDFDESRRPAIPGTMSLKNIPRAQWFPVRSSI